MEGINIKELFHEIIRQLGHLLCPLKLAGDSAFGGIFETAPVNYTPLF
jgi:hypothetical protein